MHSDWPKNKAGSALDQTGISKRSASERSGENLPRDPQTGLMQSLKTSLGSSDFKKHKALVAFELECLSSKYNRYGWERDRGSPMHSRMITDWIDTLAEFSISEIQKACQAAVLENPNKMPNEGHIRAKIMQTRKHQVAERKRLLPQAEQTLRSERVSRESANEICSSLGFLPKRFGGRKDR